MLCCWSRLILEKEMTLPSPFKCNLVNMTFLSIVKLGFMGERGGYFYTWVVRMMACERLIVCKAVIPDVPCSVVDVVMNLPRIGGGWGFSKDIYIYLDFGVMVFSKGGG